MKPYELKLHSKYAKYYDLFYEKSYSEASELIHWIIQNYSKCEAYNLLDLMCGTGGHIFELSQKGYKKL